jgi:hypothetical protein
MMIIVITTNRKNDNNDNNDTNDNNELKKGDTDNRKLE